jgi:hypothetical protein
MHLNKRTHRVIGASKGVRVWISEVIVPMLSGNDSESHERDDLHCRPLVSIPLPPEVLAQEKDIEAIFQDLIADSRDLPEVREEQESGGWILVVLLYFLSVLGFWVLYLRAH